jgi:hypothetical protein
VGIYGLAYKALPIVTPSFLPLFRLYPKRISLLTKKTRSRGEAKAVVVRRNCGRTSDKLIPTGTEYKNMLQTPFLKRKKAAFSCSLFSKLTPGANPLWVSGEVFIIPS